MGFSHEVTTLASKNFTAMNLAARHQVIVAQIGKSRQADSRLVIQVFAEMVWHFRQRVERDRVLLND
jgi:hypothetical protein